MNDLVFPSPEQIQKVRAYIKDTWKTLYRPLTSLVEAVQDPKVEHTPGTPWLVYISPQEDRLKIELQLQEILTPEQWQQIDLQVLPLEVEHIEQHGLLYLPYSYVVPGGRFNEMYGWDSYFIVLGLLIDGEIEVSIQMVEQLVYEIKYYGTVLNANRTYMLRRSQPPVLTPMIMAVFKYTQDVEWLKSLLPYIEQYYYYWMIPPHFNINTGLSRYYALGEGPAPEVVVSEKDEEGKTHYDRVLEYYRNFEVNEYDLSLYYDAQNDCLTDLYYKGDRAMRESGFDISNRFGPFSADIIHYVPVCLNALLYQMEQDIAQIYEIIGYSDIAEQWQQKANQRHERIDNLLWNQEAGLYFDYNFLTESRSNYEFATTFYPLWAGVASPEQATRVAYNLYKFEAPGGLLTSTHFSGNQWDAPFGWAPLFLMAVKGLCRYGHVEEGHRLARKYISLVVQEFERYGTIVEKYDVSRCSADVSDSIFYGYSSNEIGFGWTNSVFLEFLAILGI